MTGASQRISDGDLRAWMAMRLMSRHIDAQLARDLSLSSDLSFSDYDVLSTVVPSTARRMASKDLMLHLQWSYSRLSHHLRRMETRGLIEREKRQGHHVDVIVTDRGYAALKAASGSHLRAVQKYFGQSLAPGDADVLERFSSRVLARLPGPTPTRGW